MANCQAPCVTFESQTMYSSVGENFLCVWMHLLVSGIYGRAARMSRCPWVSVCRDAWCQSSVSEKNELCSFLGDAVVGWVYV